MGFKVKTASIRTMKDGLGLTGRNRVLGNMTRGLGGWINSSQEADNSPGWLEPSASGRRDGK